MHEWVFAGHFADGLVVGVIVVDVQVVAVLVVAVHAVDGFDVDGLVAGGLVVDALVVGGLVVGELVADGLVVDVLVVGGLFVGEMVACVRVEGGQIGDGQAEYELVEHLLVETAREKIVYRWVGCEQVVSWCAVCVFVD